MTKVAILDWPTSVAHESFSVFHQSIARAMAALGHQAEIFHDFASIAASCKQVAWDCTLAIGSHYRSYDGTTPVYERLALPHFQWIVDTPFKARLPASAHPLLRTILIDEEFAGFAGLPKSSSVFLPLGTDVFAPVPDAQRSFDLVFTGQIKDPNQDWDTLNGLPRAPRALAKHLVDRMVAAPDRSLLRLFDEESRHFTMPVESAAHAFLAANSFLRSWKRQRVLSSIRRLPVHVFGEVRDPQLLSAANFQFHGPFPYSRLASILLQSRVALNVTPNFHAACHDRIIAALACGALAATDSNPFMDAHFSSNVNLLTFRYTDLDSLESRVEMALRSGTWKAMADAGRQVVQEKFSWTSTVETLIAHMTLVARTYKPPKPN